MTSNRDCTVLMVAEKPSLALSIAEILSSKTHSSSKSGACAVHSWDAPFLMQSRTAAHFKMTSVMGHVYSTDFPAEFQSWDKTDPASLFGARVIKTEANPKSHICKHLQHCAKGCDYLVLWLDNDKEGENICFEVMDNVLPHMNHHPGKQCVFRARFSSITPKDIHRAMAELGSPNKNEALSVDARQELDLKIGVAFTRFQSRYFMGKYGNLDSNLISYGPCQTPTLGFCVQRHDLIQSFVPEPFWTLQVSVRKTAASAKAEMGNPVFNLEHNRGRIFAHDIAQLIHSSIQKQRAQVVGITSKEKRKTRPLGLNTVEMLKVASQNLGIGPADAMHIAEQLYMQGYISYPRTESTSYSPNFDFHEILVSHRSHSVWGDYVQSLLAQGLEHPKKGTDAGDHPPITPTIHVGTQSELGSDKWRLYDYIVRHFFASVSPDCCYTSTKIQVQIGQELFQCKSHAAKSPGFTLVMPWLAVRDEKAIDSDLKKGDTLSVVHLTLKEGKTSPPDYLTESELIGLMEQHGIGTDASIPTHIANIIQRNYAQIATGRKIIPTELGIVLVHGYHKIDPELVLPHVRSTIERELNLIAHGEAQYQHVVSHVLQIFAAKFAFFVNSIARMDELFEVSFSPITASGTPFSLCGKCKRYMKLINTKPVRLHCPTCNETYSLPQNGQIKLYSGERCPFDDFELALVVITGASSRMFSVCPRCYNDPPFEGIEKKMSCSECTHPTCPHSLTSNGICQCTECDTGSLVFEEMGMPRAFKISCNVCNVLIKFPDNIWKIHPTKKVCESCGSTKLNIKYWPGQPQLPAGAVDDAITTCVFCNEELHNTLEYKHGRLTQPRFRRGGGRRGGRRGRGGRRLGNSTRDQMLRLARHNG